MSFSYRRYLTAQPVLCATCSVALVIALGRHPYAYYTFLRILVCATAFYVAWSALDANRVAWGLAFGIAAILFNPIAPFYLSRATWQPINIAAAVLFAAGIIFVTRLDKTVGPSHEP